MSSYTSATNHDEYLELGAGIADLRTGGSTDNPLAAKRLEELSRIFEHLAEPLRRRLLGTSLTWTDEEISLARWLHRTSDDLAVVGYMVCSAMAHSAGVADERWRRASGLALYYMGETVKWEVVVAPRSAHDYRKPHALMREAMSAARHREPMSMLVDARMAVCTLESLYLRVLLLSRFASGALNSKQIEILDAWMWMWTPVLTTVTLAPEGAALRADLDSSDGLRRGPRADEGPALYIPQRPIETAYRALVAAFHSGLIVPSEGRCAGFRIEEHVAVLDLIRRGLRESLQAPVVRAARQSCDCRVRLWIGPGEIAACAFTASAPAAARLSLVALEGRAEPTARRVSDRDADADSIYDRKLRFARLVNTSETGFALEAAIEDCAGLTTGDVIAIRVDADAAPIIGKVVRCAPGKAPGSLHVGIRRLVTQLRNIRVNREGRGVMDLLLALGHDATGCQDAFLVSDRTFAETTPLVALFGSTEFTFRFNRARDRGRGWVLAGYEVSAARTLEVA